MSADRDYFGGCHNVPMFADPVERAAAGDAQELRSLRARVGDSGQRPELQARIATLADYVREIDAKRVVAQLELPAELMPRADGQLFS